MAFELQAIRTVTKNFGDRISNQEFGARTPEGMIQRAVWTFPFNRLPAPGASNHEQVIPAGSSIIRAIFRVITPFTSTSTATDLDIGLQTKAAVEIDDNGLLTAAQLTQTVIAVDGRLTAGTGALVNNTIGALPGELVVTPTTDDLTAGVGQVIVEYFTPAALPA